MHWFIGFAAFALVTAMIGTLMVARACAGDRPLITVYKSPACVKRTFHE